MATIQAMRGASPFSSVRAPNLRLCPALSLRRSLRITLPSSSGRQRCRITCKAAGDEDSWEQKGDTFTQYSGYIAEAAIEEADQLDEYNAKKIAKVFTRRPFLLARRLLQIAGTLGWWAAVRYGDTLFGKRDTNFKVCCNARSNCGCWLVT